MDSNNTGSPFTSPVTKYKNFALLIIAFAELMDVVDITITNVAIPTIAKGLAFSDIAGLQWVLTAYGLFFGGFVLLGGRLADTFGRRFILMLGVAIFGVASLSAGIAQSSLWLVASRAVQGFAAALITPAAMSLLLIIFKEGKERDKAMSIWGSILAGGVGLGLVLGGVITEYLGWRWIFFVNVPISIFVLIATPLVISKTPNADHRKGFDFSGAILATLGLLLLVYGLTQAPVHGWGDWKIYGSLGGAVILLAIFFIGEFHSPNPLLPLRLFKKTNVWIASLISIPTMAGTTALFFFISLYNQQILRQTPIEAGMAILPMVAAFITLAMLIPRIIEKIGYKYTILAILLVFMGGMISLVRLEVNGDYLRDELISLLIVSIGPAASIGLTLAATHGIKENVSGIVSGLLNTAQQIGAPLGVAVLSTVAEFYTNASLIKSPHQTSEALVSGFHAAFIADAILIFIAAVICVIRLHEPAKTK